MFKLVLYLTIALLLPIFGSAQITITESRFTNLVGKNFREVLYETNTDIGAQLTTIINANDADEIWDFSNLNYVDSTVTLSSLSLVDANDPNLANPNLAGATHLWLDTFPPIMGGLPDTSFQYRYGNFDDGQYTVRGAVTIADLDIDGVRDTLVGWFSLPSLQVVFPVVLGSEFHDSTSSVLDLMGMPFVSSIQLDSNWVESWGQLITPAGTMPALRVREKGIDYTPGVPNRTVNHGLDFFTADGAISAAINLDDEWAFHRVLSITGETTTSTSIPIDQNFGFVGVHPNPVKDVGRIIFQTEKYQRISFTVMDMRGATVATLAKDSYPAGEHEISWSPVGLSAGNYLLRMMVGNQSVVKKVVVIGAR
jgi:hypothetical protein